MTKRFRIMFLFAALAASLAAQQEYDLRPGDLLFQDLDCGPLCNAIEAVTEGAEGKDFSHVGMIVKAGDSLVVVEAIGEKVSLHGIAEFFARSPKIAIGRPKEKWQTHIPMATAQAISMVGVPYDDAFLPENGKLYCSELLEQAWQAANGGEPFFKTPLMTFKDPNTGEFFPAWVDYFKNLGMEIPEGIPGCNPGGLSRDEKIKIIWLSGEL
ncbi:MAG: YiiX/YebB-like N1pC/P60 family cysteine hydrolase [Bacteroidota bacterium]